MAPWGPHGPPGPRRGHGPAHGPPWQRWRSRLRSRVRTTLVGSALLSVVLVEVGQAWLPAGPALVATPLVVLLVATVASGPLAGWIVWRIERLRGGVVALGEGRLDARVPVWGHDEVADLARAFNGAADRIGELVAAERRMLASASHELRTPLTRIRLALDLLAETDDPAARAALAAQAARDIEELDQLVADGLLSGRMQTRPVPRQPVDVGALAAEEALRVGAAVQGTLTVPGDIGALRRLLRNLLQNAERHGAAPIEVTLAPAGELVVSDHGPGLPPGEEAHVFEPFHRPTDHREGDGGVGLGLALVREIASWHGGAVRYERREGVTRWVVTLPTA